MSEDTDLCLELHL